MPFDMSLEQFSSRLSDDYTAMTSQASRIFESTDARPDHAG